MTEANNQKGVESTLALVQNIAPGKLLLAEFPSFFFLNKL